MQLEHVGQIRRAQVVREDAARGVSVANVHMPADEAGRNHEVSRVYDVIRRDVRQLVRLADGGNRAIRDRYGRVRNDSALSIEGQRVVGVYYLEGGGLECVVVIGHSIAVVSW